MNRIFKWFFMLSKRLYKKASFIILLILIPACVLAFSFIAKQESGFVNIVLAQENSNDKISSRVINDLLDENSMISFTLAPSPEQALENVKNGLADEAWIFSKNTEEGVKKFASGDKECVVSIFTKEQNVSVRLSREKLTAALYKYCAKAYYVDYIRTKVSELNNLSDDQLLNYFEEVNVDEDLFTYNNSVAISKGETNYLITPIRGLLAVLVALCGMAAVMYYMQDEAAGTFSFIKQNKKGITALGCVATAVINVSVAVLLSLLFSSLATNIFREILILLLYTLCCSSFCLLLKRIFANIKTYASLIPLVVVIFIVVCPVFFNFRKLSILQLLFPPTYYVNSVFDNKYLVYMVLYSVICLALSYALQSLQILFRNIKK